MSHANLCLRVRLVQEFWIGEEGRGGEIFNLKCLVQFLEGRGGEQISLKFYCIAIIILILISNLNINLVTTFIIIRLYYLCNNLIITRLLYL